jgi:hypothetical protein
MFLYLWLIFRQRFYRRRFYRIRFFSTRWGFILQNVSITGKFAVLLMALFLEQIPRFLKLFQALADGIPADAAAGRQTTDAVLPVIREGLHDDIQPQRFQRKPLIPED